MFEKYKPRGLFSDFYGTYIAIYGSTHPPPPEPLKTRITLRLLKRDDLLLQQKVNRRMALASAFDPDVLSLLQRCKTSVRDVSAQLVSQLKENHFKHFGY